MRDFYKTLQEKEIPQNRPKNSEYMDTTTSMDTQSDQGQNNAQTLDNTSTNTNANTHSLGSSSMGNTTTDSSMMTSTILNASSGHVQQPMDTLSSMSPISASNSEHHLHSPQRLDLSEISTEDNVDIDYPLRLYLKDSRFTFGESPVPHAKPLHTFTNKDLRHVKCMSSFLYLVFRNPDLYEVTSFKVQLIYTSCVNT